MTARPQWLTGAVLVLLATAQWNCAPLRVHSFTEGRTDITAIRTFAFGPESKQPTGDPRLDDNRFFIERVQQNVNRELKARGYEPAEPNRADMLVHFHASVSQELELNDRYPGDCRAQPIGTGTAADRTRDCRPFVYDAGTLLIDLVDRRTNRLLWRGWAEGSMEGVLDKQEWMEERVDTAVKEILSQLPRRS